MFLKNLRRIFARRRRSITQSFTQRVRVQQATIDVVELLIVVVVVVVVVAVVVVVVVVVIVIVTLLRKIK